MSITSNLCCDETELRRLHSLNRRTDDEADTAVFWPLHAKNWVIGKDPDAGKD